VGPFRGGRSTAVAGVVGQPGTYYMGTTGGGVWKTTDYGESWRNVSDMERPDPRAVAPRPMGREAGGARAGAELADDGTPVPRKVRRGGDPFGSASVGALAVAPSDPNVVWVGMGSACIRGNTSAGDGVYRSTDGGDTWHHAGLPEAGQIGRLAVHPTDPDTAWVAALGHAFGANPERGVYRTTDGGATWQNVLWVSDEAGAVDLALDPSNPRVLYATFWQVVRKPWDMISGGPGSGLFKSTDGGDTWVELTEGLPEGIKGKLGVAVSPAQPNRVWALVEHAEEKGLYRSDDGGGSFRLVSDDNNLMQRPWYYTHVYADPQDADTVYVLNVGMWKSIDGGKSFTPIRTPHGDNHDLWIDPDDPRVMVEANDGGANVSTNGGRSWSTQTNQPTAEMYRVSVDEQRPYWLYGGQQDNSTVAIPSRSMGRGIAREDWYAPGGCESGHVAIHPENPDLTWAGCYGGTIERFDRSTGHSQEVTPWPQLAVGQAPTDLHYRFQWNAPIRVSPHDPDVLYHASNHVHRSRDGGHSWETISPDLSHADPEVLVSSGGPISKDNTGVEVFGTVFALEESRERPGLLWAGTDDGRVHVSEDAGGSWRDVTPAAMPEWGTVNTIELSAHDAERAFVAVHRYRLDDFRPYVFRTDDLGASWTRVADGTRGIPERHFVRAVREDPEVRGLLYAGTEYGLYASFDDGASWRSLQLDLPVTPVTDLQVHRGDLVVAT
ncbi:MAG TPA: glycosyl hydrolase, partial [Thermoanaerobaculia bacterium]|nr:glycosyl hydrolase [Thermoanaerobaculia bacterium]